MTQQSVTVTTDGRDIDATVESLRSAGLTVTTVHREIGVVSGSVDPTDRDGFVRGIVTLLGDAALRRRFGSANRERVERLFRWDACAAATARVYEDVVETWRARR